MSALKILIIEQLIISSRFSKTQQNHLNQFAKQTGIIKLNQQRRGFAYQVVNLKALESYLKQIQPLEIAELNENIPIRSRNIGLYKNSKQVNSEHEVDYLLLKPVGDAIYWTNNQASVNISQQTQLQGVSSLMIEIADNWQSNSALLLVENQALFNRLDWLPANFKGSVVYYGGHLKQLFLNWLAYKNRATELILFADYDGVGFNNFSRLCKATHHQKTCHFYLMPQWEEKLMLFGNTAIWQDNQTLFYNAVQSLTELNRLTAELKALINTMQAIGKSLEQEAIWL